MNERIGGGTTPLMVAAAERHPAAVKMLIERGADVGARSILARTAAASKGGRRPLGPGQAVESSRAAG